jgi:Xaa-Pro aminopeptidase
MLARAITQQVSKVRFSKVIHTHIHTSRIVSCALRIENRPAQKSRQLHLSTVTAAAAAAAKSATQSDLTRRIGQPLPHTHRHLFDSKHDIIPGMDTKTFAHRRQQLLERIQRSLPNSKSDDDNRVLVLVRCGAEQMMSRDTEYAFRQEADLSYLSAIQEPGSMLMMEWSGVEKTLISTLFVRGRNVERELWDGSRVGVDDAVNVFGVDYAVQSDDAQGNAIQMLYEKASQYKHVFVSHMFDMKNAQAASLTPKNDPTRDGWEAALQTVFRRWHTGARIQQQAARETKQSASAAPVWQDACKHIAELRAIKDPAEIDLMRRSGAIAAEAFCQVMRTAKPGMLELALAGRFTFEIQQQGAPRTAYTSIVACGNNATTLHYIDNMDVLKDGGLVLMDAGAELHGYASDISRTFPAGATFTPAQRQLYEIVLSAQLQCIAACGNEKKPSMMSLHEIAATVMLQGLQELKLVSQKADIKSAEFRAFFPHATGHYLGMDVHDTSSVARDIPLVPGMIITIEPGLYVNEGMDVPDEYRGIGIRIEDDILITDGEAEVLTSAAPKDIESIEKLRAEAMNL